MRNSLSDKKCQRCLEFKNSSEFNRHKLTLDKLETTCRACTKESSRQYRKLKPNICKSSKQKWKDLNKTKESTNNKGHNLRKYWPNLSTLNAIKEYEKLLKNQDSRCAICQRHQSLFKKSLHVDHCHTTLKVRALLCFSCNSMLGHAREDSSLLIKAAEYLQTERDN